MFGLLSSEGRSNNSKPLTIQNKKEPKFKQGDLVTYEHIIGTNPIHKFMAIIDTVSDDNKYTIYVIDSGWTVPNNNNNNHFAGIEENRLEEMSLGIQEQYNPDLWFQSFDKSHELSKTKKIVAYKQYIKALKLNIDFIESNPITFSDFALPSKIEELEKKKAKLQYIINQSNIIDQDYLQYEHVVYGNIIIQISAICDSIGLQVAQKEQIIQNVINTYNTLIGFAGTTFSIDLIFYKLYGYSLIVKLYTSLPDSIKQKILELLYITIIAHFNFIYDACTDPAKTLERIKEFASLLYKVFLKIAGPITLPGPSAVLPPTEMDCDDNEDLSDYKTTFKLSDETKNEIRLFEQQAQLDFTWFHTGEIISFDETKKGEIEHNFETMMSHGKQPRGGKKQKTRKINKTKHNKNKRTNKSNKKLPKKRRQ